MFVVVEGIDCSGKSSVAASVAQLIGGIVYETPPKSFRGSFRPPELATDLRRHYEYYRDSNVVASEEISETLSKGVNVVCARYWFSTLAYHRAGKLEVRESDFEKLLKPDLIVLLWVSPEVQSSRHEADKREEGKGNRIEGFQSILNTLLYEAVASSHIPFIVVNTESYEIDAIARIVVNVVSERERE